MPAHRLDRAPLAARGVAARGAALRHAEVAEREIEAGGVARVEAGIRATHSDDAWALYRAGFRNDPDYLARTIAMIVILAHPQLLH